MKYCFLILYLLVIHLKGYAIDNPEFGFCAGYSIELGNKIKGFAEFGWGAKGILQVGTSVRI